MLRKIYHKSPEPVKKVIRKVHSKTPFPYVYGLKFAKYYKWLMKTQWLPPEELEELQNKRLQIIIKHAYDNVPYYRRIFDERGLKPEDIQTKEDLKLLPVLTKDDVRKNFKELCAKDFQKYNPVQSSTAGSTGEPLLFYRDAQESAIEQAFVWRHWNWAGVTPECKIFILRGSRPRKGLMEHKGKEIVLSAYDLSNETMSMYVEEMRKYKKWVLRAYPMCAYLLAQFIAHNNIEGVKSVSVITSSETLFEFQRTAIEKQFGCRVFDWYGLGEHVCAIGQCECGSYHINSEYGIVELLPMDGLKENQREIVATGLNNFSMPLIRYRTEDIAEISNIKSCPCGRGLPIVKSITGRSRDVIITEDGRFLTTGLIVEDIDKIQSIKEWQVIQETTTHYVVNIVGYSSFNNQDKERLYNLVRSRVGVGQIDINILDHIERTSMGKFRAVISKVSVEEAM